MSVVRIGTAAGDVAAINHVRAVLSLPFMNTVVMPATLLLLFRDAQPPQPSGWTGLLQTAGGALLLVAGLALVIRAIALFVGRGHGTLAPWDPTRVLITTDIYRFSRNPMKAGLFLVLLGEVTLLRSPALAIWAATFIVVNAIYIRVTEEPGLRARFGPVYEEYCRQVPRWLPWLPGQRS